MKNNTSTKVEENLLVLWYCFGASDIFIDRAYVYVKVIAKRNCVMNFVLFVTTGASIHMDRPGGLLYRSVGVTQRQ